MAPQVSRRTYAGEQQLHALAAPDGTEVFLDQASEGVEPAWVSEFEGGDPPQPDEVVSHVDHVNLVQPWQHFDEAVLFYGSVLSLVPQPSEQVAGPVGLVRSQVMRSHDGSIRLALNLLPAGLDAEGDLPQHIAFACEDIVAVARAARARGLRTLPVPANYYEDIAARFGLDADLVDVLRSLDLLYDRDTKGEFLHFYTGTVGDVFFEVVERRDGYDGYGAPNAPVRLAAQLAGTTGAAR